MVFLKHWPRTLDSQGMCPNKEDIEELSNLERTSFVMPKMPPLPQERVVRSLPFEFIGLDYFGLLYIK